MADQKPENEATEAEKEATEKAPRRKPAAKKEGDAPKEEAAAKKPAAKKSPAKKPAPKQDPEQPKAEPKPAPRSRARREAPDRPVVRAKARFVRGSAQKARLVAEQIRGRRIEEAKSVLAFSPRRAARPFEKLLDSAVANAEENHDLIAEELRIAEVRVDEARTLKRYRPRAYGRATPIHKPSSHLAIALTPTEED